jgi:hypothetical protein
MNNRIFKFILITLIICTTALSAKNIYVKQGENGDGTMEAPYGHLWIAIMRVFSGI